MGSLGEQAIYTSSMYRARRCLAAASRREGLQPLLLANSPHGWLCRFWRSHTGFVVLCLPLSSKDCNERTNRRRYLASCSFVKQHDCVIANYEHTRVRPQGSYCSVLIGIVDDLKKRAHSSAARLTSRAGEDVLAASCLSVQPSLSPRSILSCAPSASSPYKNAGSDGKDLGADIATLNLVITGVY